MEILYILGALLGLVVVVVVLITATRLYANRKRQLSMTFLKIQVPKKESKEDKETEGEALGTHRDFKDQVAVMKQFFESLYAIEESTWKKWPFGQDFMSFEYVIQENLIDFYVVLPKNLLELVEKQVTANYPDCYIEEVPDYNLFEKGSKVCFYYMHVAKHYMFPIKTYQRMTTDPLNNMTNSLSKLDPHESAAVQIMVRPCTKNWQKKGRSKAKAILEDKDNSFLGNLNPLTWIGDILSMLMRGD